MGSVFCAVGLGLSCFLINPDTRSEMKEYFQTAKKFFFSTLLCVGMGVLVFWVLAMVVETIRVIVTWTLRLIV